MKRVLWLIIVVLAFAGCRKKETPKRITGGEAAHKWDTVCTCPPIIYIQPLNGFSQAEARRVRKELYAYAPDIFPEDCIEILPDMKLGREMRNNADTRYRADKIINSFRPEADSHNVYIGLLNDDISFPYKGKPDWGVLGLSWKGKYVSVVSTYRIRNPRRDLWKVVTHEFIHAYFNYGHCPKDDEHCLMKDAKGHADFSRKNDLCTYCKAHIP